MWADSVDAWILGNQKRKANPERTGLGKLYMFGIHVSTLFIFYFLGRKFLPSFYHQYIYSEKGFYSLKDKDASKVLKKCLGAENIELSDNEEVHFIVRDGSNDGNGIVFTSEKLIFCLRVPQTLNYKDISGVASYEDLERPKLERSISDNITVIFGSNKIGILKDFRRDDMLLEFLKQIDTHLRKTRS